MTLALIFKSISLRNFLSYGNQTQTIDLYDQGGVNVLGENLDLGGGNGSGKSGIINALCYALYNKPFGSISLERLINRTNDSKNTQMEVCLVFEKGGHQYEIFRSRGSENTISFTRDGVDITPGKGVTECDNLIAGVIGLSYELFTRIIVFSGTSVDFLQLPIAKQRALIEELFGISLLSEKAKLLKESISTTNQDIKIIEAVIKQQENSAALHTRQLAEAAERIAHWDRQTRQNINSIEALIAQISEVDFEAEQALHTKKGELTQNLTCARGVLAAKKSELNNLSAALNKDLTELEHLTKAKCPYCLQDFANAQDKIALLNMGIETRTQKLGELDAEITQHAAQCDATAQELKAAVDSISHQNFGELLQAKDNAVQNATRLQALKSAQNPHIEPHAALAEQGIVNIDTAKLDELKERAEHQTFLFKLLTDKNSFLRQKIISKNIPFLNMRLNGYTSQLGLPHIVSFDPDMSCTVAEFSRELDYDNLSQGEKKRVSTALMLAFRDVQHHLHSPDNLLFVDELDGGAMDVPGIDSIVRLLKQIARDDGASAFVISHHPAVTGRFDQILYVRKEHGFSSISFE